MDSLHVSFFVRHGHRLCKRTEVGNSREIKPNIFDSNNISNLQREDDSILSKKLFCHTITIYLHISALQNGIFE